MGKMIINYRIHVTLFQTDPYFSKTGFLDELREQTATKKKRNVSPMSHAFLPNGHRTKTSRQKTQPFLYWPHAVAVGGQHAILLVAILKALLVRWLGDVAGKT